MHLVPQRPYTVPAVHGTSWRQISMAMPRPSHDFTNVPSSRQPRHTPKPQGYSYSQKQPYDSVSARMRYFIRNKGQLHEAFSELMEFATLTIPWQNAASRLDLSVGWVKSGSRIWEKAERELGGDLSQVKDICRARVIVAPKAGQSYREAIFQVYNLMAEALQSTPTVTLKEFENNYDTSYDSGYRSLKLNFLMKIPSRKERGHGPDSYQVPCQLQFMTPDVARIASSRFVRAVYRSLRTTEPDSFMGKVAHNVLRNLFGPTTEREDAIDQKQ